MLVLKKGFSNSVTYEKSALFMADDNFRHKQITIENYEIIYVTNGTVYIQEGSERHKIEAGRAIILSPNVEHFGYESSPPNTSFFWVHYFIGERRLVTFGDPVFRVGKNSRLSEYFRMLIHMSRNPIYSRTALNQMTALILAEISISDADNNRVGELSPVVSWIESNSDNRFVTLRDVVEKMNVGRKKADALFRDEMNCSIAEYLVRQRLQSARHYILGTNLNINEISEKLGYSTTDKFIKFFKYHEGLTPKALRDAYYNILVHNR